MGEGERGNTKIPQEIIPELYDPGFGPRGRIRDRRRFPFRVVNDSPIVPAISAEGPWAKRNDRKYSASCSRLRNREF